MVQKTTEISASNFFKKWKSMKSTPRSRRHRNPHSQDDQQHSNPVFTKQEKSAVQPKLTIGQPGDKYEQEADSVANAVVNKSSAVPAVQNKEISQIQRSTLMSPVEDEKLSTAEGRMEKDKLIQEMPEPSPTSESEEEVQAKHDEEEEPVQMQEEEREREEEPVQMQTEPAAAEAMAGREEEEPTIQEKEDDEEIVQEKDEEEPLMTKSANKNVATPRLRTKLRSSKGGGRPMSHKTRAEMQSSIGADFKDVNIHTGADSIEMKQRP